MLTFQGQLELPVCAADRKIRLVLGLFSNTRALFAVWVEETPEAQAARDTR
jgi:hypothetical protein